MNSNIKAAFKWIVPMALLLGFTFQPVSADHKHYKKQRYYADSHHQYKIYGNHGYGYKHRLKHKHHYRNNYYHTGHYYHKPHHYGYKRTYRDGHRFKRHSDHRYRSGHRNGSGFYIYFD